MRTFVTKERFRLSMASFASLLAMSALATGCASAGIAGGGWPEHGLPLGLSEDLLEQGTEAEAERAVAQVLTIVQGTHDVGAQLSFIFWAERGALTLTAYTARAKGGSTGGSVDEPALQRTLLTTFQRFAQQRTGPVKVTLERQEEAWRVGYARLDGAPPSEAKTLPVRRESQAVEAGVIAEEVRSLLEALDVPEGKEAQVELGVRLEDGRVEALELHRFELLGRKAALKGPVPGPGAADVAAAVVRPFTEGLGERTLSLRLHVVKPWGANKAIGWVQEAEVLRPPLPRTLNAEFVAEYRALHEDILRRWREETREGAEWVARRGVEELALWYAGGVVLKGVGWLGGRTLPTVMRALGRGGKASAGWLRTLLKRLPGEKRQAFELLWRKVQLEGRRALSKGEREELRALMEGIEQLSSTPLDKEAKKILRRTARETYKKAHPELATLMDEAAEDLPVHHRRQLEHAHLFPDEDINAIDNLALVRKEVHEPISRLWQKFRRARPAATAREVEEATRIIDDQFKPWYNQPGASPQVPYSLRRAEDAALEQLRRLFPGVD